MRQLVSLADGDQARKLADHLLTLRIETRLLPGGAGWEVWVCDEDRLAEARTELTEFERNPSDPRYTSSIRAAAALRKHEEREEADYQRRQQAFRAEMEDTGQGTPGPRPVTVLLAVASVVVFVGFREGVPIGEQPLARGLMITARSPLGGTFPYLPEVQAGEVWRLVTPIFIHFGVMHLVFNILMLFHLAGQIEARRGTPALLALVLALAVVSNVTQFYLGRPRLLEGTLVLVLSPNFGGLSGVVYGLFGYVWVKGRREPELGLAVDPTNTFLLFAWFFVCLFGVVSNIANAAHAAGLVLGIVIGYAPALWPKKRDGGGVG